MVNLTWSEYTALWDKTNAFKKDNGRLPNYIDQKGYRYTLQALKNAYNNVVAFKKANGRNPNTVEIYGTLQTQTVQKGAIQKAIETKLGQFNTFTEFYNKMKGRGYSHYVNDIKTLTQELSTLANLNCSDASQLGYFLAKEMGYTARFVHLKCKSSGEGHIVLQVKGKELGLNYVLVDLAAAMSVNSKYSIGKAWCQDGTIISYDDPWLLSDDGWT